MGHDWMDDLLYPRYPRVFIHPSFVFVLEDGRFLMVKRMLC